MGMFRGLMLENGEIRAESDDGKQNVKTQEI